MNGLAKAAIRWFKEYWLLALLGFVGGIIGFFVSEIFF